MKKLLVILLLFFPVHGAWAEVINLICKPGDIFYTIDTSRNLITAPNGTKHYLKVSDYLFMARFQYEQPPKNNMILTYEIHIKSYNFT